MTRFPPEPNGRLHIGHAKAICIDFGVRTRVRRPMQSALRRHEPGEGIAEYVDEIQRDIRWRGSSGASTSITHRTTSSSLYQWAEQLSGDGKRMSTASPPIRFANTAARSPNRAARAPTGIDRSTRTSICSVACAQASLRRRARAACEDRYGLGEHQHARSGEYRIGRRRISAPATHG